MKINTTGQAIGAQMVTAADGTAFAGAVTVYVTGDAGVQAVGSVGAGACVHEGNGYHTYAPAQAETNYNLVAFTFIGTGAVPATLQIYTAFPQTGDSFTRIGAPAGASASADIAAIKVDTASVKVKTDFLPSVAAGGVGGVFIAGTNAATTITTGLTTTFTGSLTGSVGSVTGAVGSVTGLTAATVHADLDDIQARLPAALVAGRIDASVGAAAANVITAAAIADGAIDRATFAADTGLVSIRSGTAQAGAATTITMDAGASAVTDFYKNALLSITGGVGVGQGRFITAYNGTTKVATVSGWATTPDVTSTFAITAFDSVPGATAPTASQNATAVWEELTATARTAGSYGQLSKDNINATISSRATPTNITAATGIVLSGVTHTGAVIPTVTAVTGLTAANLDAAVSSRMATYAQPTGFLAATFPASPAAVGDVPTAIQNADALLNRDMSIGTDSGSPTVRTVRQALRFLRNKWTLTGTTLSVKKEDDTAESWAGVVTTTVGAAPITGSDPT